MEKTKIIEALHPLERKVIQCLDQKTKEINGKEIVERSGMKEIEVMRALQWLENKQLIELKKIERKVIVTDKNGEYYLKNGLPERRFLEAVKDSPKKLDEIKELASLESDELNVCIGLLKKKAAINFEKGEVSINENGIRLLSKESFEERFIKKISNSIIEEKDLKDEEKLAFDNLSKRKEVIAIKKEKEIQVLIKDELKSLIKKGIKDENYADTLTSEMVRSGGWKDKKFRRYDVKINVPKINGGRRHFVNQAIKYIKKIWFELGFKEMEGNLVQTSFWDLDTLFVPQDHPARDMQDTFYIKDPHHGKIPKDLMKKVKEVHENGGDTGSKGWGYKWSEEMAKENLLRTHTTVLSAQTINNLKKEDMPAKFFSVKRVFRNETLSWKSLFEFIQVEGIVVDPKGNFKHLKGYLKNFFAKMGYPDVRIRPAHFPYTEPSAEIDVFHPVKKQWVEIGGSGIFRPEVTKTLIGEEVPVLAWGLGMERTIMQYYNITDIRDLYRNDLKQLRDIKFWMK